MLRLQCIQAFTPVTKPSISLSAVSLETGAAEFGTVDFTEIRNVPRPFPNDAAERDCYRYLLKHMQATPDRPPNNKTRDEFEKTCRLLFHVTVPSFEYCWREANKVIGARWNQPGRRPR